MVLSRYILNPKSIRMGELYGEFNDITNEWTDGLVAQLVRQVRDSAASPACSAATVSVERLL